MSEFVERNKDVLN